MGRGQVRGPRANSPLERAVRQRGQNAHADIKSSRAAVGPMSRRLPSQHVAISVRRERTSVRRVGHRLLFDPLRVTRVGLVVVPIHVYHAAGAGVALGRLAGHLLRRTVRVRPARRPCTRSRRNGCRDG